MFFREVLNFEPDEWQAEAARDLAANPKVSIKSGQGVGKTGLEAAVFLWFITCFPYPTARYIRPTIGLTERQAAANLKYYNSIKERLTTDHPRMKPESIERKAKEAASKYAERQQRYRAETIARSEIAQAYNHGADAFVREAVIAGNLPEMEKEWSTALDGHVCASCAALEGAKIGMDDEFKTVSGRREITTSIPPLHPRCKCAVKYVRVKNENIQ